MEQIAALGVAALLIFAGTDSAVAADLVSEVHAATSTEGLVGSITLSRWVVEESCALELVEGNNIGHVGHGLPAAESVANIQRAVRIGCAGAWLID
jgi:hypothetical protein